MKADLQAGEIYTVRLEEFPDAENVSLVKAGLSDFNRRVSAVEGSKELFIFLRDGREKIVGGLLGFTFGEWLRIQTLWIEEAVNGAGYGSRMLSEAEIEALKRGCRIADVQTFGFQAPEFYRKNGYEMFGELENAVNGESVYFFRKKLKDDFRNL